MSGKFVLLFVATMLSMAFLDAAAGRSAASEGQTRPPEAGVPRESPGMAEPNGAPSPGEPPSPTGAITLAQALSLALEHNPGLASFSVEVRAADAQALQAGLRPNPELALESENILGTGEFRSSELAETTLSIRQLVELAGKRPKRAQVAILERDLAGWDYEATKADVLADTAKSFIDVLEAQERAVLTEELRRLAEQVFEIVSQRVNAGKVSPVEETRAGVVLANSRIEVERARRALESARKRLAVAWGSGTPTFDEAVGTLEPVSPVPPGEELADRIPRNPDVARWDTELERRRAEVALQSANRIPDITLEGGLRDFRETGDRAFLVSGAIPIPLFDRNQGGILAAQRRLAKAGRERAAAEANARAALAEAYRSLSTAAAEIETLRTAVIPGARSAFDAAAEGYRQGKFGFLDVLDAQRTLFDARDRYISALAAYQRASADLGRTIGAPPGVNGTIPEKSEEPRR